MWMKWDEILATFFLKKKKSVRNMHGNKTPVNWYVKRDPSYLNKILILVYMCLHLAITISFITERPRGSRIYLNIQQKKSFRDDCSGYTYEIWGFVSLFFYFGMWFFFWLTKKRDRNWSLKEEEKERMPIVLAIWYQLSHTLRLQFKTFVN